MSCPAAPIKGSMFTLPIPPSRRTSRLPALIIAAFQLAVIIMDLARSAHDQQNPQQIKANVDKPDHRRKIFNHLDLGHDLGNQEMKIEE